MQASILKLIAFCDSRSINLKGVSYGNICINSGKPSNCLVFNIPNCSDLCKPLGISLENNNLIGINKISDIIDKVEVCSTNEVLDTFYPEIFDYWENKIYVYNDSINIFLDWDIVMNFKLSTNLSDKPYHLNFCSMIFYLKNNIEISGKLYIKCVLFNQEEILDLHQKPSKVFTNKNKLYTCSVYGGSVLRYQNFNYNRECFIRANTITPQFLVIDIGPNTEENPLAQNYIKYIELTSENCRYNIISGPSIDTYLAFEKEKVKIINGKVFIPIGMLEPGGIQTKGIYGEYEINVKFKQKYKNCSYKYYISYNYNKQNDSNQIIKKAYPMCGEKILKNVKPGENKIKCILSGLCNTLYFDFGYNLHRLKYLQIIYDNIILETFDSYRLLFCENVDNRWLKIRTCDNEKDLFTGGINFSKLCNNIEILIELDEGNDIDVLLFKRTLNYAISSYGGRTNIYFIDGEFCEANYDSDSE